MTFMRAKMVCDSVEKFQGCERLKFSAVGKVEGYAADGSDEDNTYARYTPQASLMVMVANPVLMGQVAPGDKFYVDFEKVAE